MTRASVSIPHRYARNFAEEDFIFVKTLVSIPHRYARNLNVETLAGEIAELFQFLIGTLETIKYRPYIVQVGGFNSS